MRHDQREWKLALLDLDGTLYRGDAVIPGAPEFVNRLRERQIQPVFFTNNATRTPEEVCAKLGRFGIAAEPREVCTSSQAAAHWLRRRIGTGRRVGYIGRAGLAEALRAEGLEAVHVDEDGFEPTTLEGAALGLDPSVCYEGLARFCALVDKLHWFVLTNPDVRLPVEGAFKPGNGALGSFVQTATGVRPYVAGKPNPDFVTFALERFGVGPEEALIVGDNLLTDIACGKSCGVYTVHVQTGVQYESQVRQSQLADVEPDEVHESVDDLFREA
jgi:HAD superfamily hydrolase (TIGR01457 family)